MRSLHVAYTDNSSSAQGGVPYHCHCYVASHLSEQDSKRLERLYIKRGEGQSQFRCHTSLSGACNSYVPSQFVTISDIQGARVKTTENINPGNILASEQQPAYTEGRAQTCQVKKGMSPSCKHFLSGREHFLNPGATKLFLIFHQTTADSSFLSIPRLLSQQQLILTVKNKKIKKTV